MHQDARFERMSMPAVQVRQREQVLAGVTEKAVALWHRDAQ
jgi:hypothetical protein